MSNFFDLLDSFNPKVRFSDPNYEDFAVNRALTKAKRIKEKLDEIENLKDDSWIECHEKNYIRLKTEPLLSTANFTLQFCSQESIKLNRDGISHYMFSSFTDWITPFDVAVFINEALHPTIDNYSSLNKISFSTDTETKKRKHIIDFFDINEDDKKEFYKTFSKAHFDKVREEIPAYCVDIHLTAFTTKEETLKFIDDNWDLIQYDFYNKAIDSRLDKRSVKNIIIRLLLLTLRPKDINRLSKKELDELDITPDAIYTESAKFQKQKKNDLFLIALEEFLKEKKNASFFFKLTSSFAKSIQSKSITTNKDYQKICDKFRKLDITFDIETGLFHLKKAK